MPDSSMRSAHIMRVWLMVLAVVLAAWSMLALADGVALADSGNGKGATHSAPHDAAKPAHHRAKDQAPRAAKAASATNAAHSPSAPAAHSPSASAADTAAAGTKSAKDKGTKAGATTQPVAPTTPSTPATPATATTATTPPATTRKTTRNAPATAAATPVSAVTTGSSPSAPAAPSAPAVPDAATVAALGEEVQRKTAVAAQLSPGYLVNSVVNAVGGALAGTAAHLSSVLANDVRGAAQFTRQMVGLGFDVGAMAASLVNNIAVLAAHDIGPTLLWGLPYRALGLVATVTGDISKVFTGTPLNLTVSGPFAVDFGVFNVLGWLTPWVTPPGANDPSITVTAAHPLPIILINGTAETQDYNWSVGAPLLADEGYKVYTFNYGNNTGNPAFPFQSIGNIADSAQELSAEVNMVLAQTGASQVILIGHSQGGGILPEYYINNLGGASKVSQLIGIAPSNHGTNVDGLAGLLSIPVIGPLLKGLVNQGGLAWLQQTVGSSLLEQVYGQGDTRPGVIYDTIASMNDEVVTPYTQQALTGTDVTNIVVQQQDPGFAGGHLDIAVNYGVWQDILGMLAANPAASPQLPTAAVA